VRLGDGLGSGGSAGASAGSSGSAGTGGAGTSGAGGSSSGEGGQGAGPFSDPGDVGDPVGDSSEGLKVDDPSVTRDLRQLFFNADYPNDDTKSEDIYVVTRDSPGEDWGQGDAVTELNTEKRETGIAIAPDGLTIWFSSDRDGDNLDVYVSTRETADPDVDAPWTEPVRIPSLSTDKDDLVSGISGDALTLTLALREVPDSDYDIYASTRTDTSAEWPEAAPLDAFNTDGKDGDASITGEGLALVFTQGPDGGHGNLFVAMRSSTNNPFGTDDLKALDELNTPCDERDAWMSETLDYIIFSSNRDEEDNCLEDVYKLYEAYR
jgi:hypothetical protein